MREVQKQRKTLYLDGEAATVLAEMSNGSEYISGLIIRHEREWRGAWRDLVLEGWNRREVCAAVRILFDHSMVNDLAGWRFHASVPSVLGRAQAQAAQAGIAPERWKDRVARARDHAVADHLLVLTREVALGNDRARTRMEEPARLSWARRSAGDTVMLTVDADDPRRRQAGARLDALDDDTPFLIDHGPYLLDDGSLQAALTLKEPSDDQRAVARTIRQWLGLSSLAWHQR